MADLPSNPNKAVKIADEIVRDLVDIAIVAVEAAALAAAPWLKIPIVSTVFKIIMSRLRGVISTVLEQYVTFTIIDSHTEAERKAYDESVQKLKDAHASKDQGAIDDAKKDFKDNLGKLVRWHTAN